MVAEDLRPREILTPAAFGNAVTAILSVSGSINSVKHLQAVAAEAECGADVYRLFETLADQVPLLAAVRPNGEVPIEAFEDAGGTRALLKQLEPLLHGDALTVTGRTLAQNLAGVTVADDDVIRPPDRALGQRPTIVLIRGSLAPDGGIVKLAVADDRRLTSPARRGLRLAGPGAGRGARRPGAARARWWCSAARARPAPRAWAWPPSWCSPWTARA